MNTEQLDAIQARADAATEGPWGWDGHVRRGLVNPKQATPILQCSALLHPEKANAEFIAAARTDVPALLAYTRDLEVRIGRVEAVHVREVLAVHDSHGVEAWCPSCRVHWPCPTSAALTTTDEP